MKIVSFGDYTFPLYDTEDTIPLEVRRALTILPGGDGAYDVHGADGPLAPVRVSKRFTILPASWAAMDTALDAIREVAGQGRQLLKIEMRDATIRQTWAKMSVRHPQRPEHHSFLPVTVDFEIAWPFWEAAADRSYLGIHAGTLGSGTLGGNYTQFAIMDSIASIPPLAYWLPTDIMKGVYADGDPVQTWADQSGNDNHAAQANAAKRALFKVNQISTQPGLLFDGVDDEYDLTSAVRVKSIWIVAEKLVDLGSGYDTLMEEDATSYIMGVYSTSTKPYAKTDNSDTAYGGTLFGGDGYHHLIIGRALDLSFKLLTNKAAGGYEEGTAAKLDSQWWEFATIASAGLFGNYRGTIAEIIACSEYIDTPFFELVNRYIYNKFGIATTTASAIETATISYAGGIRFTDGMLEIKGACTNPKLTNHTNGYYVQYVGTLVDGDRLVVDLATGRTKLNGVTQTYALAKGANQTELMALELGDNSMEFEATAPYYCTAEYYWSKWYP